MMLRYQQLQHKPRTLLSLTSLHAAEFEALLPRFQAAWDAALVHRLQAQPRQRQYGAGRPPQLKSTEDKLLFILVYFKLYPLQEVMAVFFGLSQAQANEWIHKLTPILHGALGYAKQLPARQAHTLEQVLDACPGLEMIIDGTERRIQRPQDKDQQKQCYSGKKKTHTQKNVLITDRQRHIYYLSATYEGKKHDKAICDAEGYVFPAYSKLYKDTGFQGYEPRATSDTMAEATAPPTVQTFQPKKKPRHGTLNPDEQATNRAISTVRIVIEHAISGLKRCRIVKDVLRSYRPRYADQVMEVACGLHNYRVAWRPTST